MITIERITELTELLRPEPLTGMVFNNEAGGHRFVISCTRNGVAEPLTGSIGGRFIRADNAGVEFEAPTYAYIDSVGRAVVTLPPNSYIRPGTFKMVITHIDEDDNRTNVYAAAGTVGVGETDTTIDPENVIDVDAIQDLIGDMEAALSSTNAANVAALDNAYPGYNWLAGGVSGYWYTAANTATESAPRNPPSSYPNMKCVSIAVSAGDVFEIATGEVSGSNRMPWAVIGSDRVPIARSGSTGNAIDYRSAPIVLKVPTGGAYLLINYDPVAYPGGYVVRAKRQYDIVGASLGVPMSAGAQGKAVAESAITNGSLFIANNKLYKATANINSGSAITPGTNCIETTIVDELNAAPVTVSGTTPSITALPGVRYVCGEVSTITIVVPASGCVDIVFTSGSTPAVLTVTPPSGMAMKWANGFDPSSLDADTVYEINVLDGCLGVACTWT